MIKEKITIFISYRNVSHYLKLGYNAIINKELEIYTKDLPTVSHVKISATCMICGSSNEIMYCKYIDNVKRHGFYGCKSCSREKFKMTYLDNGGGSYINKEDSKLKNAISQKNKISINKSEEKYKNIFDESYLLYRNEVRRLTLKSSKILFKNWDGKDYYDNELISENFNLPHNHSCYPTIDHKMSIYYGYKNNIKPDKISDVSNLCVTKRGINSSKRDKFK